ncbi:GNAT family N-acetyltransferase [Elioraea sp.]|uniref:GNAT family N-acetyltransferase n=1 Tax=Elioraea sp. TaxID=2185103 RepID=UPI003F710445
MAGLAVAAGPVRDPAALERLWRGLEAEAGPIPPFRAWTWIGCLAEERYRDPWLVRAEAGGRIVGLALFSRRRGRFCLAESGDAVLDAPFIEHNAPLVAADAGPEVAASLMRAAWGAGARRLVLSGVEEGLAAAAGGVALRRQIRPAPFVALDRVRASGDPLAHLSANARGQLRRSLRRFAEAGEVVLTRAGTEAEALAWLEALIALHQRSWQARGKPGAFADPFMRRFHRELVARALPRGEVDLLRLAAGPDVLGYLYNLRRDGHVCAYQSGFDPAAADPHRKPGLVAHLLAIGRAAGEGMAVYDFLAGEDRYKRSLATGSRDLVWTELVRPRSPLALAAWLRGCLGRRLGRG